MKRQERINIPLISSPEPLQDAAAAHSSAAAGAHSSRAAGAPADGRTASSPIDVDIVRTKVPRKPRTPRLPVAVWLEDEEVELTVSRSGASREESSHSNTRKRQKDPAGKTIINCENSDENDNPKVFLMLTGSIGGGGPPHSHPPTLSTYCEAGPAADIPDDDEPMSSSGHKKGRSKALGKEIIHRVHQHGPIALRWERDRQSWKALGHEGQLYYSGVGIQVRDNCDPSFGKWEDVPSNQKGQTFRKLADWFVLDFNNSTIRDVVNRDSGLRYKEWKTTLHYYFKKRGGASNLANVRARLPDTIRDPVQWERCIERFCSEAFQKRSKKNSENRQKLTYGGRHGRVSMAEHIDQSVDPETQEPKSLIQNWEDLHRRPDGTWTHETAEARVRQEVMKSPPRPLKESTFTCPVCMQALEEASVTKCGHIFCDKCIRISITKNKKCPLCAHKLTTRGGFHRIYFPASE